MAGRERVPVTDFDREGGIRDGTQKQNAIAQLFENSVKREFCLKTSSGKEFQKTIRSSIVLYLIDRFVIVDVSTN